eukprot:TRINITY_DN1651_c0_g1_i1.p1 TRINITY_DN1651_c0_g1~~TRINITY_DN1651_c0_g1_i1.p1  ORF type:complete len:518 (-),score=134.81 TRINITY_DN1651_c0_g1_i1:140-1630(-)
MAVEQADDAELEEEEVQAEEEAAVPGEEDEVAEHLKDAVEGSLRLKRYLTQDDIGDGAPAAKKVKLTAQDQKVQQLLLKWRVPTDAVVRHVLEQLSEEELDTIIASNFMVDPNNQWKSPADIAAKYVAEMRERKLPSGGNLDVVSSFRSRWKLPIDKDKILRGLCHKDLRYVIDTYDGGASLEEVIAEAASYEPEGVDDDDVTVNSLPAGAGPPTMSRFNRLELIDPLADAAVFGDANLTFSMRLARHRKGLGHVGRVIATTFEELETLRERYKEIDESIQTLEEHYAEVYHGVDCTRIAIDPRFEGLEGSLGAVYYNYPHSGAVQGFFDGHPVVNWRHENLMRLFFRALRSFVKPGGVVKVSSNMGAVGVRYSYIIGSAIENEFKHVETMPFLEWHLHRYGRSYGDKRDSYKRPDATNNQSYNAQRAEADMVYCFSFQPSGETLPPQTIRYPPTLKTLMACTDGPFKNMVGEAKKNLALLLHKRFLTEVSGTHVG